MNPAGLISDKNYGKTFVPSLRQTIIYRSDLHTHSRAGVKMSK